MRMGANGGATPPPPAPAGPFGGMTKAPWGQLALGGLGGMLLGSLLGGGRGIFGGFGEREEGSGDEGGWVDGGGGDGGDDGGGGEG